MQRDASVLVDFPHGHDGFDGYFRHIYFFAFDFRKKEKEMKFIFFSFLRTLYFFFQYRSCFIFF